MNTFRTTLLTFACLLYGQSFASTLSLKDYTGPECGSDPVYERAQMCGAESFLVQASSSCGNTYTTMAHDSCGVQSYLRNATANCGVAEFNSSANAKICGYEVSSFNSLGGCYDSNYIPKGWESTGKLIKTKSEKEPCDECGKSTSRTITTSTCEMRRPKTCANASFGVRAYNSCEHPAHGVAAWNTCPVHTGHETCAHPNHGVASWNSCETRRTNRTCQVYFSPSELSGYLASEKEDATSHAENIVLWSKTFLSAVNDVQNMGCLIHEMTFNSQFAGNVVFDSTVLSEMQNTYLTMAGKAFDPNEFSAQMCANPIKDIKNFVCLPGNTSTACLAKEGYTAATNDAQEDLNNYTLLIQDAVVQSQSQNLESIKAWKISLETILNQVNAQ
jgi:hypothetical protein